jgi:hypothetical protein
VFGDSESKRAFIHGNAILASVGGFRSGLDLGSIELTAWRSMRMFRTRPQINGVDGAFVSLGQSLACLFSRLLDYYSSMTYSSRFLGVHELCAEPTIAGYNGHISDKVTSGNEPYNLKAPYILSWAEITLSNSPYRVFSPSSVALLHHYESPASIPLRAVLPKLHRPFTI